MLLFFQSPAARFDTILPKMGDSDSQPPLAFHADIPYLIVVVKYASGVVYHVIVAAGAFDDRARFRW